MIKLFITDQIITGLNFMSDTFIPMMNPTVTVKCRTATNTLFFCFNLCVSVMLDSLPCSFASISYFTTL